MLHARVVGLPLIAVPTIGLAHASEDLRCVASRTNRGANETLIGQRGNRSARQLAADSSYKQRHRADAYTHCLSPGESGTSACLSSLSARRHPISRGRVDS